jgi:nifR3 family TIM-barrel protein
MHIGQIKINGTLFLAPMSNVTSLPFRILCKMYGASVVYSEMINADAFLQDSGKTLKRTYFLEEERPIGIQLSGSNEDVLKRAIIKAEKELKPDLVDINIGCPAYTVMKNGCGASLLEDIPKLTKIVSTLASSVKIPLTCKIRITKSDEKTIEIAKAIEKAGAKALSVHGRTARQKYSGKANWEIIKRIKESVKIPVILNGDIVDETSAEKALKETGCDALMIGRASIGNPYLFKRIKHYLETKEMLPKQTLNDRVKDFKEFVKICEKYDYLNIAAIKMQAQSFVKGFIGTSKVRDEISRAKTILEILLVLRKNI